MHFTKSVKQVGEAAHIPSHHQVISIEPDRNTFRTYIPIKANL